MKCKISLILGLIFSLFIIVSCSTTQENNAEPENSQESAQFSSTAELFSATNTMVSTATIACTPTTDPRLPPEQWKSWPVIPHVSGTVIDIYKKGQALGRNPNAFSKIGDCQNVKEAFMGFFDRQTINLAENQKYLQETIDNFKGYFNRDGFAIKGGLNVPSSLNPLMSDPTACQPNENPLQCEIRINNPAYAFVSFELWYKGRSAENYEGYLRQVLDYLISEGVIPILINKADNTEGDNSINFTIAKLAYEYDIPMINWWYTAHTMPNNGMDTTRNDNFHISPEAWTERSYDALETLDRIWKTVRDILNKE